MPFWAWIVLIAGLSALAVAATFWVVHVTHNRLPAEEPLHTDPVDIVAPLPVATAEEDLMTERELEAEHAGREPEEPRVSW